MDDPFIRYLLAKQAIDDRSLNRQVFQALLDYLPLHRPLRIIEIGAGIGTMIARLIGWGALDQAEYLALDLRSQHIEYARAWLKDWGQQAGLEVREDRRRLRLSGEQLRVEVDLRAGDAFDLHPHPPADLLIAHAVLDLLPLPERLPDLLRLTRHLAWFTLNFDGVTAFEPALDPALDEQIERLYHRTMDTRKSGGDSRCGRHVLGYLLQQGMEVLAAGASDWVVYPRQGRYLPEEALFLHTILGFVEDSLRTEPNLEADALAHWLATRRRQVEEGRLIYIAHQLDVLVRRSTGGSNAPLSV